MSTEFVTVKREVLEQALKAINSVSVDYRSPAGNPVEVSINEPALIDSVDALRAALEQPGGVTVSGWVPIEHPFPKDKHIDILLGDGSVLCSVLPQCDGDVWWEGAGTGEKFIDPKYASVTHWRIHCDTEAPQPAQQAQLLTDAEVTECRTHNLLHMTDGVLIEFSRAIEQSVLKKNGLLS